RQAKPNASLIALSALGEGPYGFSFELKRTTAVAAPCDGESAATVLARESAGLPTAAAALAPNNCANLRREMVIYGPRAPGTRPLFLARVVDLHRLHFLAPTILVPFE